MLGCAPLAPTCWRTPSMKNPQKAGQVSNSLGVNSFRELCQCVSRRTAIRPLYWKLLPTVTGLHSACSSRQLHHPCACTGISWLPGITRYGGQPQQADWIGGDLIGTRSTTNRRRYRTKRPNQPAPCQTPEQSRANQPGRLRR